MRKMIGYALLASPFAGILAFTAMALGWVVLLVPAALVAIWAISTVGFRLIED